MEDWRKFELMSMRIESDGRRGTFQVCTKCNSVQMTGERLKHASWCPIAIMKREEEADNGTSGMGGPEIEI
jgi:hypothetical protein